MLIPPFSRVSLYKKSIQAIVLFHADDTQCPLTTLVMSKEDVHCETDNTNALSLIKTFDKTKRLN